jgi:hypothetical protein
VSNIKYAEWDKMSNGKKMLTGNNVEKNKQPNGT